jgi:hypothetical protein
MFDSGDLEEDLVFVLYPNNGGNLVYVWVGEEAETAIDYEGDMDDYAKHVGKLFNKFVLKQAELEFEVVEQDNEPEEFWEFFIKG